MTKASPHLSLDEGQSFCLSKWLYLMVDVKPYTLLRVNQGLNTSCGKEGKLTGSTRGVYLDTSIAWRTPDFYATVTGCHGPLSGVLWLCVQHLIGWQGASLTPTVLNSEMSQGLGSLRLTSSSVR